MAARVAGTVRPLTYNGFRDGRVCLRRAFLRRRKRSPEKGEAQRKERDGGSLLRAHQHQKFNQAVLRGYECKATVARVPTKLSIQKAVAKTREYMSSPARYVAEAHFETEGLFARCSLVEQLDDGRWGITLLSASRVKRAANPRSKQVERLAFVQHVMERSGFRVGAASVVGVGSRDDGHGIAEVDITDAVSAKLSQIEMEIDRIQAVTGSDESQISRHQTALDADVQVTATAADDAARLPECTPSVSCGSCDHFSDCFGQSLSHPIWELPRLNAARFDEVARYGYEIGDVCETSLTEVQRRHWRAVRENRAQIDRKTLRRALSRARPPFHYLDFEHVCSPVAFLPKSRPFETVVTQFSLHTATELSAAPTHQDYLIDGSPNSRTELARALVRGTDGDSGGTGSIFVYSSSERTQLGQMAEEAAANGDPDLGRAVRALAERLFDLEAIVREYVTHPLMRGRTGLKRVLPALVPDFIDAYSRLGINDGAAAALAFERLMTDETIGPHERDILEQDLRHYCKMDTLALVEIHKALSKIAVGDP